MTMRPPIPTLRPHHWGPAEKRNATSGPLPRAIRRLADHTFFESRVGFTKSRYAHLDVAAKILITQHHNRVVNTSPKALENFLEEWEGRPQAEVDALCDTAESVLDFMSDVFVERDPLLSTSGMLVAYYHLARFAVAGGWARDISRQLFETFDVSRWDNGEAAAQHPGQADETLLLFERCMAMSDDAGAMADALQVMLKRIFDRELPEEVAGGAG